MWLVAQHEPPPIESAPKISAPKEGPSKKGGDVILLPGDKRPPPQTPGLESPSDRNQRLQDAGVIAAPTPVPERKSKLGRDLDKMAEKSKFGEDELAPLGLRLGFNFGSWHVIRQPATADYIPDFSYGIAALYPWESHPIDSTKFSTSTFYGGAAQFYNGGTYLYVKDHTGDITKIYADTNVTEFGAVYSMLKERKFRTASSISLEGRAQYLPFRQVRGEYRSILDVQKTTEIHPHFALNPLGIGGTIIASYGYARMFSAGVFFGVDMASPFQVRMRYGINLEVSAFKEKPPVPPDGASPVDGQAQPATPSNTPPRTEPTPDAKPR